MDTQETVADNVLSSLFVPLLESILPKAVSGTRHMFVKSLHRLYNELGPTFESGCLIWLPCAYFRNRAPGELFNEGCGPDIAAQSGSRPDHADLRA
jgi:hypothetical protein